MEHAIRYFTEAREREVQLALLSEQLAGARFAALQAQVNPHFLFNTLNTIAVLVRDNDQQGAVRIVEHLSEVLRRTLSRHRANEVTLGEELELVRQYVAIEQARFSDRLRPEFRIDDSFLSAAILSFALQHLVENAMSICCCADVCCSVSACSTGLRPSTASCIAVASRDSTWLTPRKRGSDCAPCTAKALRS
jgi:LytS/YehU family sensor histidine kinase